MRTIAEATGSASLETTETRSPLTGTASGRAAFFDVDNTMIVGASIYHFARGLAVRKFFTTRDLVNFAGQQVRFRVFGKENAGGIDRVRDAALAFVADREVAEIERHGEDIFTEIIAERIWDGTLALANEHLARGDQVWLVTATPVELARIIARRLGLTGALGTISEIVDGRYTGRLVSGLLHGERKAHAITALAQAEGIDLADCSAYSDSINDVPMLTMVGHAVAVNPDRQLRRQAKANGWPIYDFRRARKAAAIAVPTVAGTAAVAGGVAAGLALRRRWRKHRS